MLSIKAMRGGGPGYYLEMAQLNYYDPERTGEPPGLWHGQGAVEFGLSGEVGREALERLCEGFHPSGDGTRLVRNAGRHSGRAPRDPGFDATFSAPKSVSVAWMAADEDLRREIERAEHRAVKLALDYLESHAMARVGAQGQEYVHCPLVWAVFRQATSRAGDPLLHSHCLCVNVTVHPDGHTSAFDTSAMFFLKMAAGALYRASLAERLAELGFAIEPDGTSFRIAGIPQALCDTLSKRREEIEHELIERFGSLEAADAIAAALVAAETRPEKDERPRAEMLREWQAIAAEHGLSPEAVRALLGLRVPLSPEARDSLRERAFAEAVARLSEANAHWNERELVQRTAEAAQAAGIGARDVLQVVERKVAAEPELVYLGRLVTAGRSNARKVFKERSEARYTTEAILALERQLLADAARLDAIEDPVDEALIERAISSRPTLAEEQRRAIRELLGGGAFRILVGDAGTGKTFVMDAVREAFEAQSEGHRVIGCTLSGIAAENLSKAGLPSDTIAMTLIRLRDGTLKLSRETLLVVDEAGMLGTRPLAELLAFAAGAGARVVLAGDPRQLQPITQGGPLKHLAAEYGAARLRDIRRQRETWHREAVMDFARGEAGKALQAFVRHRQLEVTSSRGAAMLRMVADWEAGDGRERPEGTMLLAGLVAEARALNRLCQRARLAAGVLGEESLRVGGTVLHVGDRVLFTRNHRKLGLKNGHTGTVLGLAEDGMGFTVRLDEGRTLKVSLRAYSEKHVTLGYAATTHKAQGSTLERVFILLGTHMADRHLAYVQASRSRGECRLYIDRHSAGGSATLKEAVRALSRERTKDLAHDVIKAEERRQSRRPEAPRPRPLPLTA